jgi:ADP-ribosylation factor GTPase-activating protein 1
MDKWKESELEKMKVGGNRQAKEFLESQSDYSSDMSIQQRYNTRAAALYRDKITALSEGRPWSIATSPARNYEPKVVAEVEAKSEFEARKDAMGPTGFGNTPVAEDKSSDFWGSAWSNLSTGWNSFTESASTFATYTSEKAQKAGSSFQENVWKPTSEKASAWGQKVKEKATEVKSKAEEGTLWTDMSSSAQNWATKVKKSGEKGWSTVHSYFNQKEGDEEDSNGEHEEEPAREDDDWKDQDWGEMQSGPDKESKKMTTKEKTKKSNSPPKDEEWNTGDGWDIGEWKGTEPTEKQEDGETVKSTPKKKSSTKKSSKSSKKSPKPSSTTDTSAVLTPENVEGQKDLIDWGGDDWGSSWSTTPSSAPLLDSSVSPSKSGKSD